MGVRQHRTGNDQKSLGGAWALVFSDRSGSLPRQGRHHALVAKVWLAVFPALLAGCAHVGNRSAPASGQGVPGAVLTALVADLRGKVSAARHRPPGKADVHVLNDVSRVVPGLVYYWGIYVPPGTSDVDFRSVVAMRSRQIVPTRTAADWSRATRPWEAASAEEALTACQEIVHVTRERFFPLVPPRVYRGPGSLGDARVRNVQELEARLSLPRIENKGEHGGWTARFWVVGAINVVQYQCDVAPQAACVHELQTLQGYVERTLF